MVLLASCSLILASQTGSKSFPGDEAGDAGADYGVDGVVGGDGVAHFVDGVFGEGGKVEVFLDAAGVGGGGEEGGAALNGPGEGDLGGGFVDALGDGGDDGVVEEFWIEAVAEGCEGEEDDAVLFAEVEEFPFGEVGVGFDLDDGGFDAGGGDDGAEFFEGDVGEADGFAVAVVDEAFEGVPSVDEGDAGVVEDLALGVAGVLVVAGLEGEGGVDNVAVGVVDLEPAAAAVEGGFDAFGTVIRIPEFGGDEDILAPGCAGAVCGLHGVADGLFVAVAFGAVEVAEADFEGGLNGLSGGEGIGDEGAEADGGDGAGAVGEGDSGVAKRVGSCHGHAPWTPPTRPKAHHDTGSMVATASVRIVPTQCPPRGRGGLGADWRIDDRSWGEVSS